MRPGSPGESHAWLQIIALGWKQKWKHGSRLSMPPLHTDRREINVPCGDACFVPPLDKAERQNQPKIDTAVMVGSVFDGTEAARNMLPLLPIFVDAWASGDAENNLRGIPIECECNRIVNFSE